MISPFCWVLQKHVTKEEAALVASISKGRWGTMHSTFVRGCAGFKLKHMWKCHLPHRSVLITLFLGKPCCCLIHYFKPFQALSRSGLWPSSLKIGSLLDAGAVLLLDNLLLGVAFFILVEWKLVKCQSIGYAWVELENMATKNLNPSKSEQPEE